MRVAAALICAALMICSCDWAQPENVEAQPLSRAADLAETDVEPAPTLAGTEVCGSPQTYAGLKEMIFDEAVKQFEGDTVPLNDLRRAVNVRMEFPLVQGFNEQLQRTDCTGKLVIELPPGVAEAFDGERKLEADLSYSSQPSADGSGVVLRADGTGYPTQRLVQAATLVAAHKLATAGGPQLAATYNPSFDCGRRLTNVERMICQDEDLATRDRGLSDQYFEVKNVVGPSTWREIAGSQREFLKDRSACADTGCLRGVYARQRGLLDAYEQAAMNAPEVIEAGEELNAI